jgi:hypothetical protein
MTAEIAVFAKKEKQETQRHRGPSAADGRNQKRRTAKGAKEGEKANR